MSRTAMAMAICGSLLWAAAQEPIRVDVDLVTVPCAVDRSDGTPAAGLKAEDFTLLDDGQPREIRSFWRESDLPLTVALVADISGSQAGYIAGHRDAIANFLKQVVGPGDRAMVVAVAQKTWLVSGFTASTGDLAQAVQRIGTPAGKQAQLLGPPCRNASIPHGCGGTALWHAIFYTARELKAVKGRKAIIVLSDGIDTGSDVSLSAVVEAAQSAGTVVYSLRYESPARYFSIGGAIAQAVSHGLERLSRETGGLVFQNPGKHTSEVFSRIETDLRTMYVLGFTPPAAARDGRFHKLEVKTSQPGLTIRARAGWSATP